MLEHPPLAERTSVGIASDGTLRVDRVELLGYWQGPASAAASGSTSRRARTASRSSRARGARRRRRRAAPPRSCCSRSRASTPNTELVGTVADVIRRAGATTAIPPDGAVLQARGTRRAQLAAEAPLGTTRDGPLHAQPDVGRHRQTRSAAGRCSSRTASRSSARTSSSRRRSSRRATRARRSASAPTAGSCIVAVDGRQPGYSAGITNFELALAMMQLGCVYRVRLSTPAARRRWRSTASCSTGLRTRAASAPSRKRCSSPTPASTSPPASDAGAVAERRRRRRVREPCLQGRPSEHGARQPRRPRRRHAADRRGARAPGTYKFNWTGNGRPEGSWKFSVTATDDLAQISTAERTFSLNNTLAIADGEAQGAQAAQEAHAPRRIVQARAGREGHGDDRDRERQRRARPLAPVGRAPERSGCSGTDAAPPAASRTAVRTGCTSRRRTASAASTCTPRSRRAGSLGRCAPREPYELADVVRPRQRPLRRLPADARGRRVPGSERARHGRRRRARGGSLRRDASRSSARRSRRASGRSSPIALAGTLGYLVGAIIGWWIGSRRAAAARAARPLVPPHAGAVRPRGTVVRPLRGLGRLPRPHHAAWCARSSRFRPVSSACRSAATPC